jgi:hypothetical protein
VNELSDVLRPRIDLTQRGFDQHQDIDPTPTKVTGNARV